MTELPDLTGLAVDTARRTSPPDFDALVGRARARRRRQTVGVVLATAVVAVGAGVAFVPHGHTSTAPPVHRSTSSPSPSTSATPTPRQRLEAATPEQVIAGGALVSYALGSDGSLMTVWQRCVPDDSMCRYAWQLRSDDHTMHGPIARGSPPVTAFAAPNGDFVLKAYDSGGFVVDGSGRTAPIVSAPPAPLGPDDVVLATGKAGGVLVVDAHSSKSWALAKPPGDSIINAAVLSQSGTAWALRGESAPGNVQVTWTTGSGWKSHVLSTKPNSVPGVLAVSGSRVAALSSFDGATTLPVGTLAVSTDAGGSWTDLGKTDLPFAAVDSMAATSAGILYVADVEGTLYRSTDSSWTRFTKVPLAARIYTLQPAGPDVAGEEADRPHRHHIDLTLIDDAGHVTTMRAR